MLPVIGPDAPIKISACASGAVPSAAPNATILKGADLSYANLERADLTAASLERAVLRGVIVANSKLDYVNLSHAVYVPASLPPDGYVAGIEGLSSVVIPSSAASSALCSFVSFF